jgi:hypothetical protein
LLKPGMSYQVADGAEAHMSRSVIEAKLFLVQMTKRTDLEDQPEMKEARQLLSTL